MANALFAGGIKNVRGTIQRRVHYENGQKVTTCIFASVRNGKQHIYQRTYTRTSKPSPAEQRARDNMTFVSRRYQQMTPEEKDAYMTMWQADNYMFNGKKYAILRGYCVARFLAALKDGNESA